MRAAGRIRKGHNNQGARQRTRERSKKLAQAIALGQKEVNKNMPQLRAKFTVTGVANLYNPGSTEITQQNVTLKPVYSNDPNSENHSFSKYTPSGEIQMCITNPDAFGFYVGGQEYYVDFTPTLSEYPAQAIA